MRGAPQHATAWDDLPLAVQQRILVLTGNPCARRVNTAWRDAFDAANDTLYFTRFPEYDRSLKAAAAATWLCTATRMVKRSTNLTVINMVEEGMPPWTLTPTVMLSDLLAAGAASGLATRLRKLTGIAVSAAQQLQVLQQCTGLTHLDILGSNLQLYLDQHGHPAAVELTAAIQGLRSLTRLHVSDGLTGGDKLVIPLASAMQPLTQLQHLHLALNDMGVPALAALVPALSAMPALQTLAIDGNDLEQDEMAGWAEALCTLLSVVPGLTHLNVGSCSLHEEDIALLAPVLRGMTCLQHLNVSDNHVGSLGMAILAPALAALPNLHTLDLSCCWLQSGFMSLLQPLLAKADSPLRTLALCKTSFSLDDARALAAGLSAATQLQELALLYTSFQGDQDEGWMALASSLRHLRPSLQSLKLGGCSDCKISAVASAALAAALQPLTELTRLVARNFPSPATMVAISPALMGMRRLQVLDLSGIHLSVEGTVAFAEVLPALSGSLTHLTLSSCSIDAEAAVDALAPALAQATGLVDLQLKDSSLGRRGGQWLPPVLTALPHLRKVDLRSCRLTAQGCMAIARALKDRDGMLVQLRQNFVSSAKGHALCNTPGICILL